MRVLIPAYRAEELWGNPQAKYLISLAKHVLRWVSEQDGEAGLAACLDAITRARRVYPNDADLKVIACLLEVLMSYLEDPESFVPRPGEQE